MTEMTPLNKQGPKEHEMECAQCSSPDTLSMLPLQNSVRMIGWIFICEKCLPFYEGKNYKIQMVEETP